MKGLSTVVVVFAVLIVLGGLLSPGSSQTPEQVALGREVRERECGASRQLINQLVALGDIKPKSPDWREVYVSLNWYRYDFDQKQNVAKVIGACMAPAGVAYFYDKKSGKEVARITNFGGFSVN